jgi:hypothetical protein
VAVLVEESAAAVGIRKKLVAPRIKLAVVIPVAGEKIGIQGC